MLTVIANFSEAVIVRGLPRIALTIGKFARELVYSSGSGTNTLRFTYKITRADLAGRHAGVTYGGIILPAGATIDDPAGNPAYLPASTDAVVSSALTAGKPAVSRADHIKVVRHKK